MVPVLTIPPPPLFAPRSGGWERVELAHVARYPKCVACGTLNTIEVHHIRPYHLYPELELVESNLLTLCRMHHLVFGHFGDWAAWNPGVVAMTRHYHRAYGMRLYQREDK